MGLRRKINLNVNGNDYEIDVDVRESLSEVLRGRLHLTGVKEGCHVGECGACTVLIDNVPTTSCIYLAVWANGKKIRTIEGESKNGKLSLVQQAFVDEGAIQCGFCTPGLVLTSTALVESGEEYTDDDIKRELSGHLCRCTGYKKIFLATKKALNNKDK
ncbi:MAG: xanthine dehydrogenase subunit XdhC [Sarcina sp.]